MYECWEKRDDVAHEATSEAVIVSFRFVSANFGDLSLSFVGVFVWQNENFTRQNQNASLHCVADPVPLEIRVRCCLLRYQMQNDAPEPKSQVCKWERGLTS